MAFYRKFNLLFQDIIVVGCGGTGSRIIAPLIQTIKQSRAQLNPQLYLVDGDIFEEKNLARQNCIPRDCGRNKAVVMAERYGAAHDFPVVAHPNMISANGDMYTELSRSGTEQGHRAILHTRKLIIMCVDSVNARLMILSQANKDDVIIDAGNMANFGQCSIFDRISIPHLDDSPEEPVNLKPFSGDYELPFIPAPINTYLEAMANPPEVEDSCANLDQSLAINNLMAAGIINMVQNLAFNKPFYCRTNFFDLEKGNTSERMTHTWFNQVFNENSNYHNSAVTRYSESFAVDYCSSSSRAYVVKKLLLDINSSVKFVDPALLALFGK